MVEAAPKGTHIYFLPKIHKPMQPASQTFAGRPIVATHSASIHLLDKFLTDTTKPLLALIPGSLRDTGDFLDRLRGLQVGPGTELISADVDSHYPSIPWDQGIEAAVHFYRSKVDVLSGL